MDAIAGNGGWERKEHDYYATPPEVTQALLDVIDIQFYEKQDRHGPRVWEPACGDEGLMACTLRCNGFNVLPSDYRETGWTQVVDFLDAATPEKIADWTRYQFDALVTNPPFSRAEEFIWAAKAFFPEIPIIAMLLKVDFWSAATRVHLFREFTPQYLLPLTWRPAFLKEERGNSPMMNMQWCVWHSGVKQRMHENYGDNIAPLTFPIVRPAVYPTSAGPWPLDCQLPRLAGAVYRNAVARETTNA